jgi:hypothetical protein
MRNGPGNALAPVEADQKQACRMAVAGLPGLAHPNNPAPDFTRRSTKRSVLFVVFLLGLTTLPVWLFPQMSTHDGPCHLYNAWVIDDSLRGGGGTADFFTVTWQPFPNWGSHAVLLGLLQILPLDLVARAMISLTFLTVVLGVLWMRFQVGGWCGMVWIGAVACALASGKAWAMGFDSFSLACAVATVLVGLWWRWRDSLNAARSAGLALVLAGLYFCHLVPWGVSIAALVGLSVLTPGYQRLRRMAWTAAILSTAGICLLMYIRVAAGVSEKPGLDWGHLRTFRFTDRWTWLALILRPDCIGILNDGRLPFFSTDPLPRGNGLLNPFLLITFAVALQAVGSMVVDLRNKDNRRIAWGVLGVGGMIAAVSMPELKGGHGTFLPFRIMLISIILLVPYLRFDLSRKLTGLTALVLAAGLGLQVASVWEYAMASDRMLSPLSSAVASIPPGRRIFGFVPPKGDLKFVADPRTHADAYLALWSRGTLLSNYEACLYYFPVRFRPELIEGMRGLDRIHTQGKFDEELKLMRGKTDVLLLWSDDDTLLEMARNEYGYVNYHDGQMWVLSRLPD